MKRERQGQSRKEAKRGRLDQVASAGSELLWRARQVSHLIEQRVHDLLEKEVQPQEQELSQQG